MMPAFRIIACAAAAALVQPPLAAEARVIVVRVCGGATHHMLVPGDPVDPAQGRDCGKACHAITERRGKPVAGKRDCC